DADRGDAARAARDERRGYPRGRPRSAAAFDASLQLLRASGVLGAVRIHRRRHAAGHADRGASVRRSHRSARRRRLAARHRLAHAPPAAGRRGDSMSDGALERRFDALESRLARLEALLGTVNDKLEGAAGVEQVKASLQGWVTDYVSLRLQQLVPETCEHEPGDDTAVADGPVLPGTRIRCTDEVVHRLARIPIPFVRQMVTQRVAETARVEKVGVVDVV